MLKAICQYLLCDKTTCVIFLSVLRFFIGAAPAMPQKENTMWQKIKAALTKYLRDDSDVVDRAW